MEKCRFEQGPAEGALAKRDIRRISEAAAVFSLAGRQMGMAADGGRAWEARTGGGCMEPDFVAGDDYIEIHIPCAGPDAAGGGRAQVMPLMPAAGETAKHRDAFAGLGDMGKRLVFLTIFPHGLDGKVRDRLRREISGRLRTGADEGAEFWFADMGPDGTGPMSCRDLAGRALKPGRV